MPAIRNLLKLFMCVYAKARWVLRVLERYLVGTGTSVSPVRRTAGERRIKAMIGRSRKSTSPTKTFEASAPGGIFFMKFMSTLSAQKSKCLCVCLRTSRMMYWFYKTWKSSRDIWWGFFISCNHAMIKTGFKTAGTKFLPNSGWASLTWWSSNFTWTMKNTQYKLQETILW